ncbi:MAG: HD-GYP domain-containing protein, partial [Chloroflexota bacterium]|nr:HD-GYP domain-containing protein [Chloroflexota bacterium]
ELAETYIELARTLIKFLESRDSYTRGHSDRVAELAKLTARELGLSADETVPLERAALFHDIGKVAIADDILRKPHDLHPAEMEQVQRHVEYGIDILSNLTFLNDSLPLIESHHERYDGTGYPRGLAGEDIPLGARIIAVIDAFDAITSERPYRPASSRTEAIEILRNGAGTQWCPKVVDTFLHVLEKTLEKD